jgi:SAM-dependent methyltransferase
MAHWQTDDQFWIDLQEVLFDDQRLAGTPAEIDGLLSLTGVMPPARVLDLGCGPGRHSLEMARRGYHVTGVDACHHYITQAAATSEDEGLEVEWVEGDMHSFVSSSLVDLALSLYSSMGYHTDEDDRQLIAGAFHALLPGGVFVLDLMSQETFEEGIVTEDSFQVGEKYLHRRIEWDGASRVMMDWEVTAPDHPPRFYPTEFRLYNRPELEAMLMAAGFVDIVAFGNLVGAPFDEDAEHLVLVARKPGRRFL